jgi:hypothetical protein
VEWPALRTKSINPFLDFWIGFKRRRMMRFDSRVDHNGPA